MRIKLNSDNIRKVRRLPLLLCIFLSLALMAASTGFCAEVDSATARLVAEGTLRRHLALYGDWNGAAAPTVSSVEAIHSNGTTVAYNFGIAPSGHVLVSAENDLSPVMLYSTTSAFDAARSWNPNAIESWIVPEVMAAWPAVVAVAPRLTQLV